MQGGRGNAGRFKHKKTKLTAKGITPGKHGFVSHSTREIRTINLRDLSRLTPERPKDKSEDTLPLVDLSKLGYGKLLGEGALKEPIAVRVAKASKSAAKKMEEVGGKILPTK
jgi:ribosomal protein L15